MNYRWISTTQEEQWKDEKVEYAPSSKNTLELSGEKGQVMDGFGGCFNELGWIGQETLRSRGMERKFLLN